MKRFIVTLIGASALLAGAAYGGCSYGSHAAIASAEGVTESAVTNETNPKLLAELKKQEEAEALERSIKMPVVHN